MPLPTGTVLGILADNLNQRKSVLPISTRTATRWSKGLNLPKGGDTILYTGHMYQLIPAIDAMAGQMAMLENTWVTKFFGLGRLANKFVNMSFFMALLASKEQRHEYDKILAGIARLLQHAKVDFGYLYGDEMYSGALVYDEGVDESFVRHAQRVADVFKRNGVKTIITVDPHTTNMLRDVYPKVLPHFDLEVKSYLEVLDEKGLNPSRQLAEAGVVHDSCVYARYEEMIEPPRRLLKSGGVTVKTPKLCGANTHCCGGPIESLFPAEAHRISNNRIEQLTAEDQHVISMCPICMVNLKKAAGDRAQVEDISSVLCRACL